MRSLTKLRGLVQSQIAPGIFAFKSQQLGPPTRSDVAAISSLACLLETSKSANLYLSGGQGGDYTQLVTDGTVQVGVTPNGMTVGDHVILFQGNNTLLGTFTITAVHQFDFVINHTGTSINQLSKYIWFRPVATTGNDVGTILDSRYSEASFTTFAAFQNAVISAGGSGVLASDGSIRYANTGSRSVPNGGATGPWTFYITVDFNNLDSTNFILLAGDQDGTYFGFSGDPAVFHAFLDTDHTTAYTGPQTGKVMFRIRRDSSNRIYVASTGMAEKQVAQVAGTQFWVTSGEEQGNSLESSGDWDNIAYFTNDLVATGQDSIVRGYITTNKGGPGL